ncbi:MAG: cytochrome c3 family protein [Anaerolineales bacterium]|nr:cytochrome c3 family protein [Anaerolineales bacterium]
MTKIYPKLKNGLVLLASAVVITLFVFLVFSPSQKVKATAPAQSANTCKDCHEDHFELWSISQHGSVPIDCESCHRLTGGEGTHPELPYSVQSQELTCDTCHAEKSKEWVSSRHGEIALGCATCHEPHSQQQKVLDDNQLICANCHKSQFESSHDSTHAAAGLSCENCHLGEDSGHTFKATIASCESCHSDIHEASQLITAGVAIEPLATEPAEVSAEATAEPASTPVVEETVEETPEKGGINLPSGLLLLAGLLIGGVGAWAVFGQEPGTPNPEK